MGISTFILDFGGMINTSDSAQKIGGLNPSSPTTASCQRHGCGVFRKIASSKATTGTNERNSQRNEGVVASKDLKH